ncbi:MAG: S-layer homology domain-containing protein [Anaerovoracaceae bacterium]
MGKRKMFCMAIMLLVMLATTCNVFGYTIEHTDTKGNVTKLTDFLDTKGHWAHDRILRCAGYEIVTGDNGYFRPNNNMTRGDFAIVIDRMFGLKETTYNYFTDLLPNAYYKESLLKCVAEGYITGVGGNKVNPLGFATREEVAVILCRIFDIDTSNNWSSGFIDDAQISSWARPSVVALSRLNYMNGSNNRVNPRSNITRAEVITLMDNISNSYIPKRDTDSQGSVFTATFPKNVVTARSIELVNSTVGRDLFLTQSCNSAVLNNTTVLGRLVVMDKTSLSLSNCTITQVYLMKNKSSLSGLGKGISEVYVCEFASESTLDSIPEKLTLEPGVRVRVDGVMYENTSSRNKSYYGLDLKADIADEQGYVVGGPKIVNGAAKLSYSNMLTLSSVRVTSGKAKIREMGVVYSDNINGVDTKNPTYQRNDGKRVYEGTYSEPFNFNVGSVSGDRTYRVYVKDSDGLFAYGTPFSCKTYSFSTDIKVVDEKYPERMGVEVVLSGSNVPKVRSVQVVYDVTPLYSEKHNTMQLRRYVEEFAEKPMDETRYQRFIGSIRTDFTRDPITGEEVYDVPTAFGYIITFEDGSIVNRFPVLTNAIPQGIKPVMSLTAGTASFKEDKILLHDCSVTTSHTVLQEVGIVYKEVKSDVVTSPSDNASGWSRIIADKDIGVKQTYRFSGSIQISDKTANTFYAPYVRTSNGYYYGVVSKVKNDWQGDKGGPSITGIPNVLVLGNTEVLVTVPVDVIGAGLDYEGNNCLLSVLKNGVEDTGFTGATLSKLSPKIIENTDNLLLYFTNLTDNTEYTIVMRVKGKTGLYSNTVTFQFNTSNKVGISLSDKIQKGVDLVEYTVYFPTTTNYSFTTNTCQLLNSAGIAHVLPNTTKVEVSQVKKLEGTKIQLNLRFTLYPKSQQEQSYEFTRVLTLY